MRLPLFVRRYPLDILTLYPHPRCGCLCFCEEGGSGENARRAFRASSVPQSAEIEFFSTEVGLLEALARLVVLDIDPDFLVGYEV